MVTATPKKLGRPIDETLSARRREEILHAAAHIFAERGYPNTDLQIIADELQVGKGTIYRYFPSKRELFLAAVDRGMDTILSLSNAILDTVQDPLDKIALGIKTYLAFFDEHPEFTELLIQERAEFKNRKKPTYFEYCDTAAKIWSVLFSDLIDQGRIRPMPMDRILHAIGDMIYGTMFTNFFAGRQKSCEEQAQDILDVIFNGILSHKERSRQKRITEPLNHSNNGKKPVKISSSDSQYRNKSSGKKVIRIKGCNRVSSAK